MLRVKHIFTSLMNALPGWEKIFRKKPKSTYVPGYREAVTPLFYKPVSLSQMKSTLYALTTSTTWNWERFRKVLICLATMGEGCYIPAHRRPDYIYLDGLLPTLKELRQISTKREGREASRTVFVDRDRSCLVISGITRIGTTERVNISVKPQAGRERWQIPVLTIHVHPTKGVIQGLSGVDYISFLSDRCEIIMMICYPGVILFAMKTSVTQKGITAEKAQSQISIIEEDFLNTWNNANVPDALLIFNKAVCIEFGMTLFQAEGQNERVARRIEVTKL